MNEVFHCNLESCNNSTGVTGGEFYKIMPSSNTEIQGFTDAVQDFIDFSATTSGSNM